MVSSAEMLENQSTDRDLVLAFDTANEIVAIGVGRLVPDGRSVETVATFEVQARRASNTRLLPEIDALLKEHGFARDRIACVAVGRGPGSFTGVRIAMATAKGVASALGVGLIGVSTLDAVVWNAWAKGVRGRALVVADAMRHEVYPVRYLVDDAGAHRTEPDSVVKAAAASESLSGDVAETVDGAQLQIMGDALSKYADVFQQCGIVLDESLWSVTGRGLLLALQESWRAGESDPFDSVRHNPAFAQSGDRCSGYRVRPGAVPSA